MKLPKYLQSNIQDRLAELYMNYLDIKEQYNIDSDLSTYDPTNRSLSEDHYIKNLLWEKQLKVGISEKEANVHMYINNKYFMKSIVFKDIKK